MIRRRLAAAGSLAAAAGALVLAVVLAADGFPHGVSVLAALVVALVAAWYGIRRRSTIRLLGLAVAASALLVAVALVLAEGQALDNLVVLVLFLLALGLARVAFRIHVHFPQAPRPRRPVLFFNPKSGGGKAERFNLAAEARARGIEPVELAAGDDLRSLVRQAVDGGADALAMAGGDGSQAIVAEIAAELGLPYACVPAGTRNHFALDLGVDRNDVVGSLDAFVDGGERRVDLAEVNGRAFVNNVSLGFYADAVGEAGYRDAKLRTMLELAPSALGPEAAETPLRWRGPEGEEGRGALALLVSNNVYRLTAAFGSGTRPRLDGGVLGIAALSASEAAGPIGVTLRQWRARRFKVEADGSVAAGIDGESATLEAPVCFRSRAGALRVRIADDHPGASPSAAIPDRLLPAIGTLARIAIGLK